MASELEIDKREIVYARACYYHENQHEIDCPTDNGGTVVAPFVDARVVKQHINKDKQSEINPDVAFYVKVFAHIEIVHKRSEQITDVCEACCTEHRPEQRHKYECLGDFERIDDDFLKFAFVSLFGKAVKDGFLDDMQQAVSRAPNQEVPCRTVPDTA